MSSKRMDPEEIATAIVRIRGRLAGVADDERRDLEDELHHLQGLLADHHDAGTRQPDTPANKFQYFPPM